MAWAAVGVAAFTMISGAQQAEGIRANAKLSKEVSDMNAEYAKIDSYHAEQDGMSEEARYQGVVQHLESQQNVANAANDVDSNFGTAKEIHADTELTGMLNALDIKNKAHERAMGYMGEARNLRIHGIVGEAQANFNATATQNSSTISAIGTAASGYKKGMAKGKTVTMGDEGYGGGYGGSNRELSKPEAE